jgi:hypothetical protein
MGDENLLQASRIILALDDDETTCAYPAQTVERSYIDNIMASLKLTNVNKLDTHYEVEVDDIASSECQYQCFTEQEEDNCRERYITFWVPL